MTGTFLAISLLLLIANGFFVAAEFALVAARRSRLEVHAEAGDRRAVRALKAMEDLSFQLSGAQLGITMASLGLGFVAEPAVASLIESALHDVLSVPSGVLHTISLVIALTIVVFFHMVIGEMAPKNVAIAVPERSALLVATPFRWYITLFRPAVVVLNAASNALLKLFRTEPVDQLVAAHSSAELLSMIERSAQAGTLGSFEHGLLTGAIGISELDATDAMVPRTEIHGIAVGATPAEIEERVVATGHSRFPVFAGDLDHVIGFVHAKDMLKTDADERDHPLPRGLIRPMLVVPESRKLLPMLFEMRRERRHFALVIDEHGGTSGILTIEDVVEEIVGEIRDEYDAGEVGIELLGDDNYLVPGKLRLHEAERQLEIELPEGEYDTVAGFMMDQLGRIPTKRDTVEHDGWRFRVHTMLRRQVVRVQIDRPDRLSR